MEHVRARNRKKGPSSVLACLQCTCSCSLAQPQCAAPQCQTTRGFDTFRASAAETRASGWRAHTKLGQTLQTRKDKARQEKDKHMSNYKNKRVETHPSMSESSARRLLGTLLCRPSDSSLADACLEAAGMFGTGGMKSSVESDTLLCPDLRRVLRPLNMLDMRRRWLDEVSLWPSSASWALPLSDGRSSLLAIECADELTPPLIVVRTPVGARELSLLPCPIDEARLRTGSAAAMRCNSRVRLRSWEGNWGGSCTMRCDARQCDAPEDSQVKSASTEPRYSQSWMALVRRSGDRGMNDVDGGR